MQLTSFELMYLENFFLNLFNIKCRKMQKMLEEFKVNLNQYFKIFYIKFSAGDTLPEYFIELVDHFIRLPLNKKERFLAEKMNLIQFKK